MLTVNLSLEILGQGQKCCIPDGYGASPGRSYLKYIYHFGNVGLMGLSIMSPSNMSPVGGPRLVRTAATLAFLATSNNSCFGLPHSCEFISTVCSSEIPVSELTVSTLKKIHNQPVVMNQ